MRHEQSCLVIFEFKGNRHFDPGNDRLAAPFGGHEAPLLHCFQRGMIEHFMRRWFFSARHAGIRRQPKFRRAPAPYPRYRAAVPPADRPAAGCSGRRHYSEADQSPAPLRAGAALETGGAGGATATGACCIACSATGCITGTGRGRGNRFLHDRFRLPFHFRRGGLQRNDARLWRHRRRHTAKPAPPARAWAGPSRS